MKHLWSVVLILACKQSKPSPEPEPPSAAAPAMPAPPAPSAPAPAAKPVGVSSAPLPAALVAAADPATAGAAIDRTRGVAVISYVEDLSGEAKVDKQGAVKSAELVCDAARIASVVRIAIEQSHTMETPVCTTTGNPLACNIAGSHDDPSFRITFAGPPDAPGPLVAITTVSDAGTNERWQSSADAYVKTESARLAKATCPH